MKVAIDGTIGRAVAAYTGRILTDLEVVCDPNLAGVYAVQAVVDGCGPVQFLTSGVPLNRISADDLMECEFTTWPPLPVH